MRRSVAAVGSSVFFALAPGVVAGLIPWYLTGWEQHDPLPRWWWLAQVPGIALVALGGAVVVMAFVRFVVEGLGTPAPVAPPDRLVVGGLYRYVRNPMYLAIVAAIVGQALVLAQPVLLPYAAVVGLATAAFARWYEEPTLTRRFGGSYASYRQAVPGWWPRRHPWTPGDADSA